MKQDFDDFNHVWTWLKEGEQYTWKYEKLSNILYGDTDSCYVDASQLGVNNLDDMCELADGVVDLVNEAFPEFCMHAFNCPEDRKHTITTGREVVSDKALFLSKKRYIMHILDDEGKRVDKLKIQGVEIIKSDTSEAVKEILMELVNQILDGCEREDLLETINKMKHDYYQRSVFDIATPSGTKSLGKLNAQWKAEGTLKGAHWAAKAAFMWNANRTPQEEEIYAGQKVGLVYVRHKDFNCIAYPIDMQNLSEWFTSIPIDYDRMWDGAYQKITNYMKSMGWDIASMRADVRENLLGF